MQLRLTAESSSCLGDYARVPAAFEVIERLDVSDGERAIVGSTLLTRAVERPYFKNYDAQAGHHPTQWPHRWDVASWWFAAAFIGATRVGGAVVVVDPHELEPAMVTADDAVLWDIRIHPDFRRHGVGRALLAFAESHARAAGRRRMIVETQDINVPACRFYARAGYALARVQPHAYAELPDEVQLVWRKDLAGAAAGHAHVPSQSSV